MPRPGSRPYECIRRAWHGDNHLTLRGTLIQEIFRVVNEIHSPTTTRKKEWQEKLPMVVLRAEDILYSKANSEAEYMDLKTLRSRLNDSINTMIRRDVSTEGGNLLEPCVEAALSLGCLPKKGTRGQRHNSRSCEGGNQKQTTVPPAIGNSSNYECSSLAKPEGEISLHGNGVYRSAVRPAYHFLDSQHYIFTSIPTTVVSPGSLLCSPSVATFPSQNGSHLFSLSPCNRSHIETLLNFNQEANIPTECRAQFYEQTYPGTIQGGQVQLPQLGARTETGPICMPLSCPQLSTSTINAKSTTWGIPSSYLMNVASITSSSGEGTTSSATSGVCFAHPDLDLQIQVPCISSQMGCLPQTDPANEVAAVLTLDELKPSIHPTEEISSEQALNAHDLQLRLGPPGNTNTFSSIAVTHTAYVDPCSNNAWAQSAN